MLILLFLLQTGDPSPEVLAPPTVRFDEKECTLQEAFDKIPGLRFGIDPKIAKDLVTPPGEELNVFDAVHALCKAHGGARLFFSTYAPRIEIRPGKLFSPPTSNSGHFHFLISIVLTSQMQTFDNTPIKRLFLTLWMTWTGTGSPAYLEKAPTVTRVEDNQGNTLKVSPQGDGKPVRILGKPVAATSSSIQLTPPSEGSTQIKILEGYRRMTFIREVKPVEIFLGGKFPSHSATKHLSVTKMARGKGGLSAVLEGPTPHESIPLAEHLRNLQFVDQNGNRYPTRITTQARGPEKSKIEVVCIQIPENAQVVSARTDFVTRWETREIHFSFKNIPLP